MQSLGRFCMRSRSRCVSQPQHSCCTSNGDGGLQLQSRPVRRASSFRVQDVAGILTAGAAVFGFVVAEIPRAEAMIAPAITGYMLIEPRIAGKSVNVCQTSAREIERFVDDISRKEQVPRKLLARLIQMESGYRPCAVSSKGALGLMQLMPATLSELNVSDPFDPQTESCSRRDAAEKTVTAVWRRVETRFERLQRRSGSGRSLWRDSAVSRDDALRQRDSG